MAREDSPCWHTVGIQQCSLACWTHQLTIPTKRNSRWSLKCHSRLRGQHDNDRTFLLNICYLCASNYKGYCDLNFQSENQSSCSSAPCTSRILNHQGQSASLASEWPEHLGFELYVFLLRFRRTAFSRNSVMTALKPSALQNAAPACNINSSQVSRWIVKSNNSPPICKKVVRMALRLNPQEVSDPASWFLWKRWYFAVPFHSFCCLGEGRIMRIWRIRLTWSIPPLIDRGIVTVYPS